MDVLKILKIVMNEKGISENQLSKNSGVPQSTINAIFRKNRNLTFYTLEQLCKGLDISLVEFFSREEEYTNLKETYPCEETQEMIEDYSKLNPHQRKVIKEVISEFNVRSK